MPSISNDFWLQSQMSASDRLLSYVYLQKLAVRTRVGVVFPVGRSLWFLIDYHTSSSSDESALRSIDAMLRHPKTTHGMSSLKSLKESRSRHTEMISAKLSHSYIATRMRYNGTITNTSYMP